MDYNQTEKSSTGILMEAVLNISSLRIGYFKKRSRPTTVAGPLNIEAYQGEFICLIGPNGSGKTTLMRTISKVQPKLSGHVRIASRDIDETPRKTLAKQLSVVLTDPLPNINLDVQTLIALGRYPHTGWFGSLTGKDKQAVSWAITSTGLQDLYLRNLHELSDGELQKAMIARALCQDTPVMLLDEPTAHLDVANRIEIIRLLKNLAKDTGKTIILSTHELDLALRAADKIWILDTHHAFTQGVPEDLVLNGTIATVFGSRGLTFDMTTGAFDLYDNYTQSISISGDEVSVLWTTRSLQRNGFETSRKEKLDRHVDVSMQSNKRIWEYSDSNKTRAFDSIGSLLKYLRN